MAELIVGPIVEMLIKTCLENLPHHLKIHKWMKNEKDGLRDNCSKIQAVVSAASEADIKDRDPALNKWLRQLRDAIDEAEDLLDEFLYMEHEKGLAKNKEEEAKKLRSASKALKESASKVRKVAKGFFKTYSNLKRLETVVQQLHKISAEVSNFLYLLKDAKQEQQKQERKLLKARIEGSFPKSTLIGRGEDKEKVMKWLRKPDDETDVATDNLYKNISLLSIVGHGGMGKTSLLQHVYHQDEMTKEFDLKMWVCVSNNFEVREVIAAMLESATKNRPSSTETDALQQSLMSEVMSKKFLLVLDDVWEKGWDINNWETVLAPLIYGSLGSKILMTTRMDCVASMISKVIQKEPKNLSLKGLKEDECLQLLKTHAFANVKNLDEYKKLEFIAGELVEKLHGSPLAAKVIGGVLNNNLDEGHWTNVLKNNALGHDEILPILKLSYTFLPKELRNCFTFCSIFPEDYRFDKDDLVRMWIAVGFIQPYDIKRGEDLEDAGGRYFDILVQKSFFDKFNDRYYKMHDLLHDMTRSISAQDCFRFVGDEKLFTEVPETIRHLFIKTSKVEVLRNLGKFKNLRTLWITCDEKYIKDFDDVLTEIFNKTRKIRLLCIDHYRPKLMPETIGDLKHLRYLKLNFDNLTILPKSLFNLYHMQFIIYDCGFSHKQSDFFPSDISNLSNLRYTRFYPLMFAGIGKLKFLQDPIIFFVKNEIGYRIEELKYMNNLRILNINCLENVRDAEEACNAKLCDKRKLTELSLCWGEVYELSFICRSAKRRGIADPDLDERVLDSLQPHHNLKVLKMHGYMGVRSAKWMNEADSIKNLEKIGLHGCLELQNLPPFGQLRFLKVLELYDMPKVKRLIDMRCIFQSLERLKIVRLEALEDWFDGGVQAEEDGCLFPCLTELTLEDCPNLQELPYLSPKLKKLLIKNIGWKSLNCYSISKSIPLEALQVLHCSNITYIFLAGEIGMVEIEDCPNLIYFGGHEEVETIGNIPASVESLQCLPSSSSTITFLNSLTLRRIPLLKSLPDLPPSLCDLSLLKLDNLDCLPSCLPTLSSLTYLQIEKVPKLRALPDLPPSLCKLYLYNLDNLDCLPSCLPTLSSLIELHINQVPKVRELPDLPPSLIRKHVELGGLMELKLTED